MSNGHGRSTDGFGIDRNSSVNLIVKTALENGVTDTRQIAYMLATAQHETRNFSAPEEDFGRSQARKLGYSGGEDFYGRGYVHLTHDYNYKTFDKLLGLNGQLVKNPDLAKDPELAAKILVVGMRDGLFTGKRLDRYIDEDSHDLYNARRTVNGVTPAKAWTVKAAKDCQNYAEAWERKLPGIIEDIKKNGVSIGHADTRAPAREPAAARNALADGLLKQDERGPAVRGMQESLNKLGYHDARGQALRADGDFGERTKEALQAFQRAHGLKDDGIAGPKTLEALKQAERAPLLSNAAHPDHAMFKNAVDGLEKLGPQAFKSHAELERAAATLTYEAKVSGLSRIDHVVPTANGGGLFAVQGALTDPGHQRVHVDKDHAAQQPIERSPFQTGQDAPQLAAQTPEQKPKSHTV